MPYYKDIAGKLHWLSPEDVELGATSLLPQGAVEITDDEASALLNPAPDPNAAIDAQILALEATVTQRRLREAALTDAGRAWMADVDAQIAALRSQRV